jgi:hypothetical protein
MLRAAVLILLVLFLHAVRASAQERYFAVFYGCQDADATPSKSHSFATFLKGAANGEKLTDTSALTLSWLPVSGNLRLLGAAQAGHNLTYRQTLAWAEKVGARTTRWGPFEIDKKTYDAAVQQYERLQSGNVEFKVLDPLVRPAATNCIHAVADILPSPKLRTGTARGNAATEELVEHFRPTMIEPGRILPWVLPYFEQP